MMDIIRAMMTTTGWNDTDRRPKDWNETLMYLYPNGSCPLTGLLSTFGRGRPTSDPQFHWWTKGLPSQRAKITGVYTDALSTTYNPAAEANLAKKGDALYFKMAEAEAKEFRSGHQVQLRDQGHPTLTVGIVGIVNTVVLNGDNSYIKVTLLQGDMAATAAGAPGTFAQGYLEFLGTGVEGAAWIIGNMNAEGASIPTSIVYEPVKYSNLTQIFRTPLSVTRTAKKQKLRTGDQVAQAKKEALEMHGIEREKACIFGVKYEGTDALTGNPIRASAGIINFEDKDGNKVVPSARFSGTWTGTSATGWTWFFGQMEELFRDGSPTRIGFCGSTALMGMNTLARENNDIQVSQLETKFGMKFNEIVTPFGTLMLKQHPLFSQEPMMRKAMLIIDPDNLERRIIDDTAYLANRQSNDVDGETSEYLTEEGYELHHPTTFRFLDNIGG